MVDRLHAQGIGVLRAVTNKMSYEKAQPRPKISGCLAKEPHRRSNVGSSEDFQIYQARSRNKFSGHRYKIGLVEKIFNVSKLT